MSNNSKKKNVNNPEDLVKIKEILANHTRVYDRHIHLIPNFFRIKYINKETGDFSHGGELLTKKDHLLKLRIARQPKSIIWNIDINKNVIYVEDIDKKIMKRKQKANLHKLYEAGMLKLVD